MQPFPRTLRGMRFASVLLFGSVAVACSSAGDPAPATPEPVVDAGPDTSPTYLVNTRADTGVGPFSIHQQCTGDNDTVVSGSCKYLNMTPEDGTDKSGIDARGWFCDGTAPKMMPYGWVEIQITCKRAGF